MGTVPQFFVAVGTLSFFKRTRPVGLKMSLSPGLPMCPHGEIPVMLFGGRNATEVVVWGPFSGPT